MSTDPEPETGLTLVEMLVTIAILGVVMTSLATVYATMADGMMTTTSRASALEELSLAASQIALDLRNIAFNSDIADSRPFRLVGVDPDETYENSTRRPHRDLSTNPNEHSDRLHFHAYYTDDQISPGRMASERVYYAFWVNGRTSPKPYSGLSNRYGLLKRRAIHSRFDLKSGALIPLVADYTKNDSVPSPLFDLNRSTTNHRGIGILGINIDYLSVRYFNPETETWETAWDSRSKGFYPSVIQFALRAYDRRANEGSAGSEDLMSPIWYQTAVSLRNRN